MRAPGAGLPAGLPGDVLCQTCIVAGMARRQARPRLRRAGLQWPCKTGRAIAVLRASRKVRTPQGGIAANGRPVPAGFGWQVPRNRATETSLRRGRHWRTGTAISVPRGSADPRRCRVKRGNLYPEQHQIGMRCGVRAVQGDPPEHAGRWLERASNGAPRGMIARPGDRAYRIRPIDLSCPFSANRQRRPRGRRFVFKRV